MRSRLLSRLIALIILAVPMLVSAQDAASEVESKYPARHKTLVIINSFSQNSPWTKNFTAPITMRLAQVPEVHCELYYLNSSIITDSLTFETVQNNMFSDLSDVKPDYLVMIGKMAFNMRSEIKKRWGDIPMLLVSNGPNYADLNYYFSGVNHPVESTSVASLADLRSEYNFSAVVVPNYYRETIDLMVDMLPEMKEVVFAAEPTFINRSMAKDMRDYLIEEYPGIKFTWLEASIANSEKMQVLLANRNPEIGILLSTWSYERPGPFGYPIISNAEVNLVSTSVNPVFVLHESYLDLGAVGGVFYNVADVEAHITKMFDDMLAGRSMREVPFYNNDSDVYTMVNYTVAVEHGIDTKLCPKNTVFLNRPQTYWQKYHWHILGFAFVLIVIVFAFWKRNLMQKKEIELLTRHRTFVDKMPVPYSKAALVFNNKGKVINITYSTRNEAFDQIIKENSVEGDDYLLFPADFIGEKARQLLDKLQDVKFVYHFDKTDKYYEFVLSLVHSTPLKTDAKYKSIDVFAMDVTKRVKMEKDLKDISEQLDLTINVAGIIPWNWNLGTDELSFDAYSLFERKMHDFEAADSIVENNLSTIDATTEFFPLVHPDDYDRLYSLRVALYSKDVDEFKCRYRLRLAHDGEAFYQWIEIRGRVTKRDAKGNVKYVAGAMWRIDESDVPEADKAPKSDDKKSDDKK